MKELKSENLTLGALADLRAGESPDREGLVDVRGERRLTFRQIKEESDSLAKALIRLGLKKGDHAALIMDSSWENVVTKIALEKAGAVIVNLNIHESATVMEQLLFKTDVKAVFVKQGIKGKAHMEMLLSICPELETSAPGCLVSEKLPLLKHIIATDETHPWPWAWQFETLLKEGKQLSGETLLERQASICPGEPVTIIHTSGTSGIPKGVVLTHEQLLWNARRHVEQLKLTGEDRFFSTAPMFHSLGCVGSVITAMMAGATLICYDRPENTRLLEVLKEERCSVLCSVPTVYIRLVEKLRKEAVDTTRISLRLCLTAGAPCPKQTLMDLKELLGVKSVITMYGMTEAGPGITSSSPEDSLDVVVSSAGRLWPGVQARIRDLDTGEEAAPGTAGEICVKSPSIMKEYYKDPEETRKAIDENGWLHTGDVGLLNEEGLLILKGRCKDLIIRGGENLSPREIEDFLRLHENIEDAAVVGAPDEPLGEMVFAFLKMKPGTSITLAELEDWCKGKIATIKIPRACRILEEFPVSATGKVAKGQLRKMAAAAVLQDQAAGK